MVTAGTFPAKGEISKASQAPRVGDGIIRLNKQSIIEYASPNASSAFRRLGLATDLINQDFAKIVSKIQHNPGPVDEAVMLISSGRVSGEVEIENPGVVNKSYPNFWNDLISVGFNVEFYQN